MPALTLAERWAPLPRYDLLEPDRIGNVRDIVGELRRENGDVIAPFDAASLGRDVYASGERVLPGDYVAITSREAGPPVTYCEVVDQAGATWLVYWWWYARNGFHWALNGLHYGDWECVVLRVPAGGAIPDRAAYAQHSRVEVRPWHQVRCEDGHPLVFVALGSHAARFDRSVLGNGLRGSELPVLEVVSPVTHPWTVWPGRWGQSRLGVGARCADSPVGPGRHRQWRDPEGWIRTPRR